MTLVPVQDALAVDAKQELKNMLDDILKPGVWAIRYVASNQEARGFCLEEAPLESEKSPPTAPER